MASKSPGQSANRNKSLKTVYAAVLAGGQGTRLWPLSRRLKPKQFLALQKDGQTLLQNAFRRASLVAQSESRVLVLAQANHADLVRQQLPGLPESNLILEPTWKNTAASIGLAAFHLIAIDPEAVMAVLPADHLFADEKPWFDALRTAVAFASREKQLVAVGVTPTSPSPNYGYLKLGEKLFQHNLCQVFEVRRFVEKPERALATQYFESGEYLWNTGTFAWSVGVFLNALKTHLPALYTGLKRITANIDSLDIIYPSLEEVSVDYGVMEKSSRVAVVKGNFLRIDVGALPTLAQVWPADSQGNAIAGDVITKDSLDNVIYTDEGLVGLIGMKDTIIIRRGDVVLVCSKERAHEVKDLVAALAEKGLERYR
jgi:mannose-1-phosphate guanylyltransferase